MAIAIIPARYASSRFPGKPLADRTGRPVIAHVCDAALRAGSIDRVIVATDDPRIRDAVIADGSLHDGPRPVEAVMTSPEHPNGTSRIAEVVEGLLEAGEVEARSVIVNVQGDEPEIESEVIDALVAGLEEDDHAPMATLAADFMPHEDPADPNIVKLVIGRDGRALYFSRSLIPFPRDPVAAAGRDAGPLKHPGLYAYRAAFVIAYARLEPTPLEQAEQLEQLRALEHGHPIAVIRADVRHHGIDTPEQYEDFVRRFRNAGGV